MENEIIDKVQAIIIRRRMNAITENQRRIEEINKKIPEISEINSQLFFTSRELMMIISTGAEVQDKIENLKRSNLGAQEMIRQLLINYGYPEDYLEIKYTCPECQDTGYSNNQFCNCFRHLVGVISTEKMNSLAQVKLSSFDTFSLTYYQNDDYIVMKKILDFTRSYANNFNKNSCSILMFGKTGLGKTHLSLSIANVVLSNGYSVIYDSIINILRMIEKEHFGRSNGSDTLSLILECDLLILDDLGTEYETPFYSATIYNIINTRLNSGKPTIISTNLDYRGIEKRYDERVVSRLCAVYTCLEFKGEDVRLQKRKQ